MTRIVFISSKLSPGPNGGHPTEGCGPADGPGSQKLVTTPSICFDSSLSRYDYVTVNILKINLPTFFGNSSLAAMVRASRTALRSNTINVVGIVQDLGKHHRGRYVIAPSPFCPVVTLATNTILVDRKLKVVDFAQLLCCNRKCVCFS